MIDTSNQVIGGVITRYDIYFILIFISLSYLFYKDFNRKEGFGQAEDIAAAINTRYAADVDAIRNLSNIATTLTTAGGLINPGALQVNGSLNLSGKKIDLGFSDTTREANAGKIEYGTFNSSALCITGKGTSSSNRIVQLYDNVNVAGSLTTGGSLTTAGEINTTGMNITGTTSIKMTGTSRDSTNGFIEANYGVLNNRYGMGMQGGITRLYCSDANAGGYHPACVALSLARANGSFADVLKVDTAGNVTINGNLIVTGEIKVGTVSSPAFIAKSSGFVQVNGRGISTY
jgi:hypothetical protein